MQYSIIMALNAANYCPACRSTLDPTQPHQKLCVSCGFSRGVLTGEVLTSAVTVEALNKVFLFFFSVEQRFFSTFFFLFTQYESASNINQICFKGIHIIVVVPPDVGTHTFAIFAIFAVLPREYKQPCPPKN